MDSLESERGELKNRLKETTMKALLEGMARGSPSLSSNSSGLTGSPGPISIVLPYQLQSKILQC